MRRTSLSLVLSLLALFVLATPASALTGTGTWDHLGTNGATPPGNALNGQVSAMLPVPGGLLVGGSFSDAGGKAAADRIAKWNGTAWSALGPPLSDNGSVLAIAVAGGKTYVGGNFTNAGGDEAADYLAVFDGGQWKPFCNATATAGFVGAGLQVLALKVVGPTLYVGGTFQNANNVAAADYLIGCNLATGAMTTTVAKDGDFTGPVYDLTATSDGTLYAGGTFSNLDGDPTADRIAAYGPSGWHGLGPDIGGYVRGLYAVGMNVFVSSDGVNIAGNAHSDHLVKWDGSTYSPVGANAAGTDGYFPVSAQINELTSMGSILFAAGTWQNANGAPAGDMIAYFDGSAWRPIGSNGAGNGALGGEVHALALFAGQLYAGGSFAAAGRDPRASWVASRSLRLPDMSLDAGVGSNVYSPTAVGESRTISVKRGTGKTAGIMINNDGLVPATFRLRATGAATGYTIKYIDHLNGDADVTAKLKAGTYTLPYLLAPQQTYSLRMVITVSGLAAADGAFVVTATSTPGTPRDAVRIVVHPT